MVLMILELIFWKWDDKVKKRIKGKGNFISECGEQEII